MIVKVSRKLWSQSEGKTGPETTKEWTKYCPSAVVILHEASRGRDSLDSRRDFRGVGRRRLDV